MAQKSIEKKGGPQNNPKHLQLIYHKWGEIIHGKKIVSSTSGAENVELLYKKQCNKNTASYYM